MSNDESDQQSDEKRADDGEQSIEESGASDQPAEQSEEQPAEQTDQPADTGQAVDQPEEKPADGDQPAEQSEEQPADSDQPAEPSEEQPADSDQPAEQSDEQLADSDQPATSEGGTDTVPLADAGGGSGTVSGSGPAVVDPFPVANSIGFSAPDASLATCINAASQDPNLKDLCTGVIDLTGLGANAATLPYVGHNDS
jgi:hypothetical protein